MTLADRVAELEHAHQFGNHDPAQLHAWAECAARWEALRLRMDRGLAVPADRQRYDQLTAILRQMTARLGLDVVGDDCTDPRAVPGITQDDGHIAGDLAWLMGETWQESAEI